MDDLETSDRSLVSPPGPAAGPDARCADGDGGQARWLGHCVGDAAGFLSASWDTAPYVNRGEPGRFSDVIGLSELSQLIAMGVIPGSKIRLIRGGRPVPERFWSTEEKHALVPDIKHISRLLREGHSMSISHLEQFAPGVHTLCSGLGSELSRRIRAYLHLTPPSSQGFLPHYDNHDVIVLQLEGEKEWQVFERATSAPVHPTNITPEPGQSPVLTVTIRRGDSLYVPRGFVHCAATTQQLSLHVSVGIFAITVADALRDVIKQIADEPALTRTLAAGFTSRPADLAPLLAQAAHVIDQRLADPARVRALAAGFCGEWQSSLHGGHDDLL
jgi:cupin superfamily protein